jgi:hypothetical protein
MESITYKSYGVPIESYELTRADHRDQRISDDIREAVLQMSQKWREEEAADPGLRERRTAHARHVWETFFRVPTPDRDLTRWRVRLYCGHITETRRHRTMDHPTLHGSSSMLCPECGKDPARIVAYESLGSLDGQPASPSTAPVPSRRTRAQLEQRIEQLEAELAAARRGATETSAEVSQR